jgi:hypothetical protein
MARQWVIEIFDKPNGDVIFRPDVRFVQDNQPLTVKNGDAVSWTNRTEHELTIVVLNHPLDPNLAKRFDRKIAARDETSSFPIKGGDLPIAYRCVGFPQQHNITAVDAVVG